MVLRPYNASARHELRTVAVEMSEEVMQSCGFGGGRRPAILLTGLDALVSQLHICSVADPRYDHDDRAGDCEGKLDAVELTIIPSSRGRAEHVHIWSNRT